MEYAKNVLISVACTLRHSAVFRFAFLRSDLSCHHSGINLSNLSIRPDALFQAAVTTFLFVDIEGNTTGRQRTTSRQTDQVSALIDS